MDEDVAAILGLTVNELEHGVAVSVRSRAKRRSTWALAAVAVVIPGLAAALLSTSYLRRMPNPPPADAPPRAMSVTDTPAQAAAPDPGVEGSWKSPTVSKTADTETGSRSPQKSTQLASRQDAAPVRRAPPAPPSAQPNALSAPPEATPPPETILARNDTTAELLDRSEVTAARLEAVDALRALRQR